MKHADVIRLEELGLISTDQRVKIIETMKLREEGSRLLWILTVIGVLLTLAGVVLLISSNWDDIPRGVKLAAGIGLMVGAWIGGYRLRENDGHSPKVGEALYVFGAGMWLANIALVGQIYNLSSRTPNAFFFWFAGIAGLPWILRSKALFSLSLVSFGLWMGVECGSDDGFIGGSLNETSLILFHFIGLALYGWGMLMRGGPWHEFSGPAEKTGLLTAFLSTYPLCWKWIGWNWMVWNPKVAVALALLGALSAGLIFLGSRNPALDLTPQWRRTWFLVLAGVGVWFAAGLMLSDHLDLKSQARFSYREEVPGFSYITILLMGAASLLMLPVGIALRRKFMVNLGVTFIALVAFAAYIDLMESMAFTGGMFVVSGIFLVGFGYVLERRRRTLLARMQPSATASTLS